MSDDEQWDTRRRAAQRSATRWLTNDRPPSAAELLAEIAAAAPEEETQPDTYGTGPLVEGLERRIVEELGTAGAVFLPSGTMGQQAVLRSWCDRVANPVVALHALNHPLTYEDEALVRVQGLQPVQLAAGPRQPTVEDVERLREPVAVAVIELPLRDAGYLLPTWDELVALIDALHDTGAKVHLDGARLWESSGHLGHTYAEIVALFDSAYVSFYKGLQAPAGAAVAGDRDLVEQVRLWQHRLGGTLFCSAPFVVAARHGLDVVLPRVPARVAKAPEVAAALTAAGLRVWPDPPHTNAFRVFVEAPADDVAHAVVEHAE